MKIKILLGIIITIGILTSCENSRRKHNTGKQTIEYSNKTVLDSLIKTTPHSTDTLFLGFTIGMTKADYKKHVHKLRNEGKTVSYSSSNRISNMAGTFELGAGYTFKTSISTEKDGKTLTGNGQYFLEPVYNRNGNLMQLNILPIEKWDGDYGFSKPNWLETKVKENSERLQDQDLKQALIDNEFIDKYDFVRQKDNLVIYETTLTVNYIDLKTLLLELLIKETEKEIIKEDNEDIKF
ncbi:hypothetical protein [Lacinutrix sp. 5H-3-7-4]|uniref:hypothetical protein n=1 Tax=Lacinutrix sp. (strain 5H-3-7-4) TaxID=983544 RepID=UPI00020A3E45|nr:hypothetical protein [Lacinutrix sp. 5H-3-7-4]AEH01882.1 hypothetical protein Lacal_2036 [Lacinutrix sp. 5H-3-7-4]